ncbi:MAG: hypothetical protein EHM20_09665 [Alphaproteobacteria bacterium]|nr:MAG: hypothetical protein EHM20_09665 [Alphaproteobacteria bacterium]
MKKLIIYTLAIVTTAPLSLAATRKELLEICSYQSRKIIKETYLNNNPEIQSLGLTTWLSKEDFVKGKIIWQFAHIANIHKANNEYYSWDFKSEANPTEKGCETKFIEKTFETRIYPCPTDDNECSKEENPDYLFL